MQLKLLAPADKAVPCDLQPAHHSSSQSHAAFAILGFSLYKLQCSNIPLHPATMDQEKATLPILPAQRWAGVCAPMKRPKEIACFSYNAAHEYRPDASGLRYYYPPRLGADLCKGFESFEKLDDTPDDHLDSLLKTIMEVEREKGEKVDVDVVTWRGMMTKLLASPFSDRDG